MKKLKLIKIFSIYAVGVAISMLYNKKNSQDLKKEFNNAKDLNGKSNSFKVFVENFIDIHKSLFNDVKNTALSDENLEYLNKKRDQFMDLFDEYKNKSFEIFNQYKEKGKDFASEGLDRLEVFYDETIKKLYNLKDITPEKINEYKEKLSKHFESLKQKLKK